MATNTNFRFSFRLTQNGEHQVQLFGTDTRLSPDELERKRRAINRTHFPAHITLLWIVDRKGRTVSSSGASKLPAEPLFVIE